MTIKEIKTILGVDITAKCRRTDFIYLRCLYAKEMRPKQSLTQIAKSLKLTHASVFNILKNYDVYKNYPLFNIIEEAYINKDKSKMNLYFEKLNEKFQLYQKESYKNFYKKVTIKAIKIKKQNYEEDKIAIFGKPSLFKVAENLRFKDTYLNKKQYNKWTVRDLKQYYNLIK